MGGAASTAPRGQFPPPMASVPSHRAFRDPRGRWVAGVCTGIAKNLNAPLPLVRLTFLILTLANGLGVLAYLAFWAVLPQRREDPRSRESDFLRLVLFGLVVVSLAVLAYAWGWSDFRTFVAPLLVLGVGTAMLWQQWDAGGGRVAGGPGEGIVRWLRPALGIALVGAAAVALVIGEVGWIQGLRAIAVMLLFAGGAALIALPWLLGVFRDLATERRDRLHDHVRADLAVQVHDSVLQTLTLIQANADDSAAVTRLARTEERRLRSWLYAPVGDEHATLAAALAHAAAEVESDHSAAIDVVQVGEAPMTERMEAVVAAAREAMVNAAKHTGANPAVSVYCEVADGQVEVFVRDRGPGFDPAAVPVDRHGVRESIIARMQRIGGNAEVTTSDRGTEVRLMAQVDSWV